MVNRLKIIVTGAKGRMGRALVRCIEEDAGLELISQVDLGDDLLPVIKEAQVVIDFSFHDATLPIATVCAEHARPLVIGTTGHGATEQTAIRQVTAKIPVVWASNYSTGVNVLFWLTQKAAEILGPGFDAEIIEMHHRHKEDAPSGTALSLAGSVAAARQRKQDEIARYGRHGITGERTAEEIGIHSLRGGDVVGDHTVVFAAPGERLELTHRAASRDTFALGALRAAKWVVAQSPGMYSMRDVLGLK